MPDPAAVYAHYESLCELSRVKYQRPALCHSVAVAPRLQHTDGPAAYKYAPMVSTCSASKGKIGRMVLVEGHLAAKLQPVVYKRWLLLVRHMHGGKAPAYGTKNA